MTVRRFFTLVRRADSILLLVLAILGCAVVAYAGLEIYREASRTRFHAIRAEGGFVVPIRLEAAQLRMMLDSVRQEYDLPALGAAVFTKDSVLGLAVVGVRRIGTSTPATAGDLFHIGSDTKAMTAGLLGLLVDRGKLRWESRLDEIFPDLQPSMRPEYRDLTVRELLTHRSGIVANPAVSFIDATPLATPRAQREAAMRWFVRQPLATPRGSYAYANSNYIVAGAIAERLFDGDYEHLLIAELLAPLGITTAGFGAPGRADIVEQPWGHRVGWFGFRRAVPPGSGADNSPVFGSAGRLHLSLPDWARWGQAVIRAARGEPSPWSPTTGKSLVTPLAGDASAFAAAFGWGVGRRTWAAPTGRVLSHAGSNGRWYAVAWLAPDTNFGLLVVTNQGGDRAARATDAAAAGIIRMSRPERAVGLGPAIVRGKTGSSRLLNAIGLGFLVTGTLFLFFHAWKRTRAMRAGRRATRRPNKALEAAARDGRWCAAAQRQRSTGQEANCQG